jgi:transposase
MRTKGSPEELEHRRQRAVRRYLEGYSRDEIAAFLDVAPRTVWRRLARFHEQGPEGLASRPVPGRPPELTTAQEKVVRRWLTEDPTQHGFTTELWTGPRRAELIRQEFGIRLNPRYLWTWMRARGFTPQEPQRVAREADPEGVAARLKSQWPRIKERHAARGPTSP